jgi:hypothetical protein
LSQVKILVNVAIGVAVVIALFAVLKALPGFFGSIGESISKAVKDAVAGGAGDAGETAGKAAEKAGAGIVKGVGEGLSEEGDSIWKGLNSLFVKWGSKDQRTPLDTDSTHFESYYSDVAAEANYQSDADQGDVPNFAQMVGLGKPWYALDDQGNIVNQFGQLQNFNPGSL